MQQANRIDAAGGREASRLRREQLVAGKAGLPPAKERVRTGEREAGLPRLAASTAASAAAPMPTPVAPAVSVAVGDSANTQPSVTPAMVRPTGGRAASLARREALVQGKAALQQVARTQAVVQPSVAPASANTFTSAPASASRFPTGGRDASVARRNALVQGKKGLQQIGQTQGRSVAASASPSLAAAPAPATNEGASATSRQMAQAVRANRATFGRGGAAAAREAIGSRIAEPIQYPRKVADTSTYGGGRVTGVRIGRGSNVTGDEPGATLPVTGSQYYGTEAGFQPRHGGIKVGAVRTEAGLTVTGTMVRSQVEITGDEYNSGVRITGEADQAPQDDLTQGRERMAYSSAQFQRKSEPHGHSVFGTSLGRAAKSVAPRDRANALESSEGGLPISGTAVGRSGRVTGDEDGAHRAITGDQYVSRGRSQPEPAARANAQRDNERIDPVTGSRVNESATFGGQRVTGVNIEHKRNVTGDEYGATTYLTGTPYVGPGQVPADRHVTASGTTRVTGNTPLNVERVTGTQRGGDRAITGTAYFRADPSEPGDQADVKGNVVAEIEQRFSVRSPQREAQLRKSNVPVPEDVQERITGSFAVGHGKITGNQEFQFKPRVSAEQRESARQRITGEGRSEGPAITGGAWGEHGRVTGTDGHFAHERNPSERAGKPQAFANAALFKGKGNHKAPTQHVTGMVGWSAKTAARVTLSGGAQG